LNFGNVNTGSTSTQTVILTNSGNADALITQISIAGSGFSPSSLAMPYRLAAGASVALTVTFAPSTASGYSGTLTITSDSSSTPTVTVGLSGMGTQPPQGQLASNLASVSFGNVNTGSTSTQTVILTNTGNASLTITQVSETGSAFSMTGLAMPYALAAGATVSVTVSFAPTAATAYSGGITILSNAANSSLTLPLSGTGTQVPQAQISAIPASVNFDSMSAGASAMQTITLKNSGNAAANITQITISGTGFSVSGTTAPLALAAGATVSFQVAFSPALAGVYSGTVTVTSDAMSSPLAVSLSGMATHSVSLSWTDEDSGIAGYSVYRATQSGGPYSKISNSLIAQKAWIDGNVQAGGTYYYVITATGNSGVESAYSVEVMVVIPNP
ncbi:MAG TPA: choice-of-anchor D domain-containing protein, partial [Terriglobales bacterium]|nr:choice-of-anchor D domain-containing protein [Terriglobales bacterium]